MPKHGFTREHLKQAGYIEMPDGSWQPRNADLQNGDSKTSVPKLERSVKKVDQSPSRNEEKRKDSCAESTRYQLVVISYRPRLIDSSNGCVKWIEDAVVNAGLMPDDAPQYCAAPIFHQIKVPGIEQRTEVYLFKLHV